MYYRPSIDDLQYTYPLDFCPIYNIENQEIVHIDIPKTRRPLNTAPPTNYDAETVKTEVGLRDDLKPINISQPQGVSFQMDGRKIDWQKVRPLLIDRVDQALTLLLVLVEYAHRV
jgi:primary-amine oxidase